MITFFQKLAMSLILLVLTLSSFTQAAVFDLTLYEDENGISNSFLHNRNGFRINRSYFQDVSGTYNSVTGELDALFTLNNSRTLDLSGVLDFSDTRDNTLDNFASLDAVFARNENVYRSTQFYFAPRAFGNADNQGTPNTLVDDVVSLWGSNWKFGAAFGLAGLGLGLDAQLQLIPTPLPSTMLLFGFALVVFGLFRTRSRKQLASF